jgi:putative hydrolase of the HAD superfamily
MNIVFDFAGVVFHWQPVATLRAAIPQHALDDASAEHWAAQIFTGWGGDWGDFDRGRLDAAALITRTAARTGLPAADVQAVVQAIPRALRPDVATVALIEQLRSSGHRLLYLSNMPEPYALWLEQQYPLQAWFDGGVFSARVDCIKPEPAIFAAAEEQFAACGEALVFLDDVLHNVRAAQLAGWRALHYRSAEQARAGLAAMGIS